jgi:hypothetical protein
VYGDHEDESRDGRGGIGDARLAMSASRPMATPRTLCGLLAGAFGPGLHCGSTFHLFHQFPGQLAGGVQPRPPFWPLPADHVISSDRLPAQQVP